MKHVIILLLPLFLMACSSGGSSSSNSNNPSAGNGCGASSNTNLDASSASATYCVTLTGLWTAARIGELPNGAHFSTPVAAAVTSSSSLWLSGALASPGMKALAEDGSTAAFINQITAEANANRSSSAVTSSQFSAQESVTFQITFQRDTYNRLTFASMVAPSPDWFIGLSRYAMRDSQGQWISDSGLINLAVYDAGTESGTRFTTTNPATIPAATISRLTENVNGNANFVSGFVNGNAIAQVRIRRIR